LGKIRKSSKMRFYFLGRMVFHYSIFHYGQQHAINRNGSKLTTPQFGTVK